MNRISLKNQETLFRELEKMQREGKLVQGEGGRVINLVYEIDKVEDGYLSVFVINTFKIKLAEGEFTPK